jgi:Mitogen-activated protein kinase kinase 1 interacting
MKASKMGLKRNKSIIGIYGLHQVIQIDCYPLIISLVADATANTGERERVFRWEGDWEMVQELLLKICRMFFF